MLRTGFTRGVAINPSDADVLTVPLLGLWVSTASGAVSDVAVQFELGTTVIFADVPSGTYLPLRPQRVMATGTSADLVIGLWA